jgi:hypothetical protein
MNPNHPPRSPSESQIDQVSDMLTRRPGLVTFAAIMMFVAAGFEFVFAITEFFNAAWFSTSAYGTFGGYLWLWGILDLLFAGVLFYVGYDLLRGGQTGFVLGILLAGLSALRWFFYLPAAPVLALVVIGVDILIIYGLTSSVDYFRQTQFGPLNAPRRTY